MNTTRNTAGARGTARDRSSLVALLALGLLIALAMGCSLLVNFEECTTTADCSDGWSCSADGLCEAPDDQTPPTSCTEDDECGAGNACVLGTCEPVSLVGGPCLRVDGPVDEPDAFHVGVVLQLTGTGSGFGKPMLDAVILAMEEINGIAGVRNRPIGLVVCDTEGSDERARQAARHLVDRVGAQAIIGFNSSQVIDVSSRITVPAEVLVVSPSATAVAISNLEDNGLVWRTAPSDAIQARALGELVNYAIEEVVDTTEREEIKLSLLVRQNDRYATGLSETVVHYLPDDILHGGEERFAVYDYPNIGAGQPANYSGVIGAVTGEAVEPDVVMILGSAEAWEIAAGLDAKFEEKQPLYFVADAVKNSLAAMSAPEALEGRIWGTAPRNVGEANYAPYLNFRVKYQARYRVDPNHHQFVANAYDALYLIALAAAAEGFDGPALARGMERLSSGESVVPQQDAIQNAMRTLAGGGTIDYQGASGPLDFDERGDPQTSPIALWCFENKSVPEKGIILDDDLEFTPRTCGVDGSPDNNDANNDANNGDGESDGEEDDGDGESDGEDDGSNNGDGSGE